MQTTLPLSEFLQRRKTGVLFDVRTPAEYRQGHIPGALNLPLFTDEERAVVGTLYVRTSRESAIEKGLEFVGPKMAGFVKEARRLAEGRPLLLYCWRGGMRSGSMTWLMRTAGMEAFSLAGGYKAWRRGFETLMADLPWKMMVVSGMTGCGKTDVLGELRKQGEQVLDLEALACHRGSAFGALGQQPQPSTEHFGNLLHETFLGFDPQRMVWVENESKSIGQVFIPEPLWGVMSQAPAVSYSIPHALRCRRLASEYGGFGKEELCESFRKIEARLGGQRLREALALVQGQRLEEAAAVALHYYDKGYALSTEKQGRTVVSTLDMPDDDPKRAAERMIQIVSKWINQ